MLSLLVPDLDIVKASRMPPFTTVFPVYVLLPPTSHQPVPDLTRDVAPPGPSVILAKRSLAPAFSGISPVAPG